MIRSFACFLGVLLLVGCNSTVVVGETLSVAPAAETNASAPTTPTASPTPTPAPVEVAETRATQPAPPAAEGECSAPDLPDPWIPSEAADLVDWASARVAFSGEAEMWVLQTDQGWGGPAAIIVRHGEGAGGSFSSSPPGGLTHHAHFRDEENRLVFMVALQMESTEFEQVVRSAEDLVNQGAADFGALAVVRSGSTLSPDFSADINYEASLRDGPKNRTLLYYCDSDASATGGLWATDPMLYAVLILELLHEGDIRDLISVDLGGLPGLAFAQHEDEAPDYLAIGMADGRALFVAVNSGSLDDPLTSASFAAEFADLDLS